MEKISFIIANHNTLNYTKLCYNSLRKNLSNDHQIILLSDGSSDGTNELLKEINTLDKNSKIYINEKNSIGIAYTYNKGVEMADNDIVCVLHSDMYVPPKFDEIILSYIRTKYDFITAYRVEPPIYPSSNDKFQYDFGMTYDTFNEDEFIKWCESNSIVNKDKSQPRTCFPWIITKEWYNKIGGNDTLFLKYMVDDDDFYLRMKMSGARYAQIFDACVYHFCSRSTKYKNDIIDQNGDNEWNSQYNKSTRNFIRKWGFHQSRIYSETNDIVINPKYNIGAIIKNANINLIQLLEPYFTTIYVDETYINNYINNEQPKTLINLNKKIKPLNSQTNNDILIEINGNIFIQDINMNMEFINFMHDIMDETNEIGEFEYSIFKIKISKLERIENLNIINERIFKIY